MRGTVAKSIRKHVRAKYPFLSTDSLYRRLVNGQLVLAEQCQRALVQSMKRTYKKRAVSNG